MKSIKPNKPKVNLAFASYLASFNTQSTAVMQATRAWAAEKLIYKKQHPFAR